MSFRMPTKHRCFHSPRTQPFVTMLSRIPTKPRSYYSNMIFVHLLINTYD